MRLGKFMDELEDVQSVIALRTRQAGLRALY